MDGNLEWHEVKRYGPRPPQNVRLLWCRYECDKDGKWSLGSCTTGKSRFGRIECPGGTMVMPKDDYPDHCWEYSKYFWARFNLPDMPNEDA